MGGFAKVCFGYIQVSGQLKNLTLESMQKIEIQSSKTKLILMFIGCNIFIVLALNFAINPQKFTSYVFRNIEFIRTFGIIASILFSVAWVYFPVKLFDKKPGLILDENGINDNSSAVSVGLILWKDIVSIRTEKIQSTKFLIINIDNAEKYLKRSSKFKRFLLKTNMRMYGTPITISSTGLKYNFENLEKLIRNEFEKY